MTAMQFATPPGKADDCLYGSECASGDAGDEKERLFSCAGLSNGRVYRSLQCQYSLFLYNRRGRLIVWTDGRRLAALDSLLKLDQHATERFVFVSAAASYRDVRDLFERRRSQPGGRLVAAFVTENGQFGEPGFWG